MDADVDGAMTPDGGGHTTCARASDCDDGLFCNGAETCSPGAPTADSRGCLAATTPRCLDTQTCDEATDQCTSDCATHADADGDDHPSIRCGGDDCDDSDAQRYPGNREACDAVDRDEDCDPSSFGFRDQDGDGEPDAACCNDSGTTRTCGTDCDDAHPSVHPGATEACNSRDDDCDTAVDEGVTVTLYHDQDGDGFGDPAMSMNGCAGSIPGYVAMGTDCNDAVASINPSAADTCDADMLDEDCSGTPNDPPGGCSCSIGDSRACLAMGACASGTEMCIGGNFGQCSILPSAEICNQVDDDCNGVVDDGLRLSCWVDGDADGYARADAAMSMECAAGFNCPVGYTTRNPATAADCNDANGALSPASSETCNGVDDNCNGVVDEMLTVVCYVDEDNDTYAPMGAVATNICPNNARASVGFCPIGYTNRAPASAASIDCVDTAGTGFDRHPGAPELCDTLDNDCNGMVDDGARATCFVDADDDGYAATGAASSMECKDATRPDRGYCPAHFTFRDPASSADCNAADPSVHPGAVEICDAVDQNCNGSTTDVMMIPCYSDADRDGYAPSGAVAMSTCPDPTGLCPTGTTDRPPTTGQIDCAPASASINPAAVETCDAPTFVDQNCNGNADEGSVTCYHDGDDDGYAPLGATGVVTCTEPTRVGPQHGGCPVQSTARAPSTPASADCNDASASDHAIVACYPDSDGDSYRNSSATPTNRCSTPAAGYGGCPLAETARADLPDCCDVDPAAHAGQTAYFTNPRNLCGGYDFNCDGVTTQQYASLATGDCSGRNHANCTASVGTPGWLVAAPACGTTDTYQSGCAWTRDPDIGAFYCDVDYVDPSPIQACR
ncbi:MAG: putative metal-binding motif-containing protein [Sandaracinus sp.]